MDILSSSQSHPFSSFGFNSLKKSNEEFVNIIGARDDYYEDEYYEYDEYTIPNEERNLPRMKKTSVIRQKITSLIDLFKNQKQLGASLLGLGLMLTFAGMMLFFEGTLLRLGNMCIIVGIPLLVGPDTVRQFFIKKERTQATVIISIGILLVFWGKPRLGILFEIFGLLNLFGNMNPLVVSLIKKMPVIGDMIAVFEKKDEASPSAGRQAPGPGPGPGRGAPDRNRGAGKPYGTGTGNARYPRKGGGYNPEF